MSEPMMPIGDTAATIKRQSDLITSLRAELERKDAALRWYAYGSLTGRERERLFNLADRGAETADADADKRAAIADLERQGWKHDQ